MNDEDALSGRVVPKRGMVTQNAKSEIWGIFSVTLTTNWTKLKVETMNSTEPGAV
jgi:hypothetical protein